MSLKRSEIEMTMRHLATVVREHIKSALEPLIRELAELRAREPLRGEKGEPGIDGKAGPTGSAGNDGIDGKDGAPGLNGKDGSDGKSGADGLNGKDGRDGIDGKDGAPGRDGAKGEPGEPGADGKDGAPGRDGRDGMAGPAGKDGLNGKDGTNGIDGKDGAPGLDGLGFDDMTEAVEDGGRVIVRRYSAGERVKEFRHTTSFAIYRGVFSEGKTYEPGDMATWGGSVWHCNAETIEKPGDGSKSWTLAVKKGRDGRDGKNGEPGERGPEGKPGRDRY